MGQLGDLYAEGRNRFIDLAQDADPATSVPACPSWTVKDVLSHVAGISADILAGRLDGVATDPWTAAQVDARRDRSIAEICAEWQETGPQIDPMVDSFGATGEQLLFDLTTHELDVRGALGAPMPGALAVYDVALGFVMDNLAAGIVGDRGPLQIDADGASWSLGGESAPKAELTTTKLELIRAIAGRRSRTQVTAMKWHGDPTPFLDVFASGPFSFPDVDIVE